MSERPSSWAQLWAMAWPRFWLGVYEAAYFSGAGVAFVICLLVSATITFAWWFGIGADLLTRVLGRYLP